jgi:hypothetical protein
MTSVVQNNKNQDAAKNTESNALSNSLQDLCNENVVTKPEVHLESESSHQTSLQSITSSQILSKSNEVENNDVISTLSTSNESTTSDYSTDICTTEWMIELMDLDDKWQHDGWLEFADNHQVNGKFDTLTELKGITEKGVENLQVFCNIETVSELLGIALFAGGYPKDIKSYFVDHGHFKDDKSLDNMCNGLYLRLERAGLVTVLDSSSDEDEGPVQSNNCKIV